MMREIINKEIKCLDKGFVRLVDYMGDDSAIVQAARVSYGKGTKSVNEDRGLIRYLLRNKHTSPFEMVDFKFHVKLPIFIARQWIRHRTASVNEYSGRYSVMKNEFYVPEAGRLQPQSKTNKQGSDADAAFAPEVTQKLLDTLISAQNQSFSEYEEMIDTGLARELARINLPLSTYTEWYWKIDLHNLLHFLRLRMDHHAQKEIQVYGEAIAEMVKEVCPLTYEAFEDYTLNSITLNGVEMKAVKSMIENGGITDEELKAIGMNKMEIFEFNQKMKKFN